MPRKPLLPSIADEKAAPGGAAAVDRAMSLLAAFHDRDRSLSLTELAERARLYKSTVLRLIASLEHARLVRRLPDGSFALGPEIARLAAVYQASFSLEAEVLPVLRELMAKTRESAAFHVRQGDQRLCLYRVDSPHVVRDHTKAGDLLPLDRGAGGRVLSAYAGAKGAIHAQIRRDGIAVMTGDRVAGLAGISAPVFGPEGEVVGALTLTMPTSRMKKQFAADVRNAAARLTARLGGSGAR
jgi:DNA-binding IclR family transcriptional regulator